MSYQALMETLLKEGEDKTRAMLERARAEAEAILQEAKVRADRFEQETHLSLQKEIRIRRNRILSRTGMEGRRIFLEAKHKVLEGAFEKARERLSHLTDQADPRDSSRHLWSRLIEECLQALQTQTVKAVLHTEVPSGLEQALQERGIQFERIWDPDLCLGFKFLLFGGKVEVTDSFKTRLEKVKPDLLVKLNTSFWKVSSAVSACSIPVMGGDIGRAAVSKRVKPS